jgi:hypothetical protein
MGSPPCGPTTGSISPSKHTCFRTGTPHCSATMTVSAPGTAWQPTDGTSQQVAGPDVTGADIRAAQKVSEALGEISQMRP